MFCVNCGQMIPNGGRFCPACGTPAVQPSGNRAASQSAPAQQAPMQHAPMQPAPMRQTAAGSTGGGFCGVQLHNDFAAAPPNSRIVKIEMCGVNRILFKGNQRVTVTFNGQQVWDGYVGNTAVLDAAGRCEISVHYHMHANFYPGQMNCTIDPSACTYYCVVPHQSAFHLKLTLEQANP